MVLGVGVANHSGDHISALLEYSDARIVKAAFEAKHHGNIRSSMRPKFALTAMVALASTVAHAGDTCRVNDPTRTLLNLRASPNGHIVCTLSNGDHVTLLHRASDRRAKTWVHVGVHEYSKPIGSVFLEFLPYGMDPAWAIKYLKPDGSEEPCVRAKPEPPLLMDELHQLIQALSADRTRPSWPSTVDVTKSAESDNTYGNAVAPYIRPGRASIPIATPKEVSRWVNTVPDATGRSGLHPVWMTPA
jgi:hypothetical protein